MHEDSKAFQNRLASCLGPDEGRAVFREICRVLFPEGNDFLLNAYPFSEEDKSRINSWVSGIEAGIPLQYLTGKSWFLGLELEVNSSVLIPRPETEELVNRVLEVDGQPEKKVLDLCTGSGCIALALAKLGNWAMVEALDVSMTALETARINASRLGLDLNLFSFDLLSDRFSKEESWDIWVSNPPYVTNSEAADMEDRVLKNEPHLALFVPDDDALIFYRRILQLSEKHLKPCGEIYLELNPVHAEDLQRLYAESALFQSIDLITDMSGKQRFLKAQKMA